MKQTHRLATGGRINRDQPINFIFNGRHYKGFAGDSLASALLANGVQVVGRSFKFHRPRGVLSAGVEEPNALVKVGQGAFDEPNVRATMQPLYEGLRASSQNCWPTVGFDLGGCFDWVANLLPAGFYNKTFIWPHWHLWEGLVRRAAGLGTVPVEDDTDDYVRCNAHCDVLICGAGPAGLTAALTAANRGARVTLVDEQVEVGGSLLWSPAEINGGSSDDWIADAQAKLVANKRVTLLTRATVTGYFDHNVLLVSQKLHEQHGPARGPRERLWTVRAKEVILASGSIEQPLLFANNDRPGIMLSSAVSHYANRYAVAVGRHVVLATNNDSAYQTALDLTRAGINVVAIIDSRAESQCKLVEDVQAQGIKLLQHCVPVDTRGRKRIRAVSVGRLDSNAPAGFRHEAVLTCDCLAMSGGWQPTVHLFSQARGKLRYDAEQSAFRPEQVQAPLQVIGAASGSVDLSSALKQGFSAGMSVAEVDAAGMQYSAPVSTENAVTSWHTERVLIEHKPQRQWIDFQHDATVRDINIAVQENFTSVEHVKRYTTTGMSVDQGKTSNVNALFVLANRTGKAMQEVGTTTFRPFYMPVTLGSIAGHQRDEHYSLVRRSPMHVCHQEAGATLWDYGHWKRPAVFPLQNETLPQAMRREAQAVRQSVGIYDGSPLGKIEVVGADAADFLNRLYINNMLTLKVGRARYGIMLNENGVVIDDGIVACLQEQHFLVHTTSANADHIYEWMEEWHQCEWPELDITLTKVSSQWANVAVSGPKARLLVERLDLPVDLDNERFPHMSIQEGEQDGIAVRVMRASFTGELGYEINVPADYGYALWQQLLAVGKDFNVTPYGVESLMLLRTEKGYLHVGADTDGNTTPDDIGWGAIVNKKAADFIGKRSLKRSQNVRSDRLQLVGLEACDSTGSRDDSHSGDAKPVTITAGAHIVGNSAGGSQPQSVAASQGFVTSAFYSPHLARYVALGLVENGRARIGDQISLMHNNEILPATIVNPVFLDHEGERLHA